MSVKDRTGRSPGALLLVPDGQRPKNSGTQSGFAIRGTALPRNDDVEQAGTVDECPFDGKPKLLFGFEPFGMHADRAGHTRWSASVSRAQL
jgi:hypothetical protein